MPNQNDLTFLRRNVDWERIYKYPKIEDQFNAMMSDREKAQEKIQRQKVKNIQDWVKDNKRWVKNCVRNFLQDGSRPYLEKKKDKKISVDFGKTIKESKAYKITENGIFIPNQGLIE